MIGRTHLRVLMFPMMTELNAGSRVHCYQFAPYFAAAGIKAMFCSPSSVWLFRVCNDNLLNLPRLISAIIRRLYWHLWVPFKRLVFMFLIPFFDLVFVERGLAQHCSRPWLEMLLYRWARLWQKRIVYFLDDPIYLDCPGNIQVLMAKADAVIVVTEALAEYARRHNSNVIVLEDAIDLDHYPLKQSERREDDPLVIGWVGNSTVGLRYLDQLREPLTSMFTKFPNLVFRVVSGRDFLFDSDDVPVDNVRWSMDYEASVTFDIGLAPLTDSQYDQIKASYKILQYWAHGIPVVCSQTADSFLEDGVNCLIVNEQGDWETKLSLLASHPELRVELGSRGRQLVENRFALNVKGPKFASMLEELASGAHDFDHNPKEYRD